MARIEQALAVAGASTGLTFSVYVGELREPVRQHAESLHNAMRDPGGSVLLAVSPNQRVLEIVTGEHAHARLSDRICEIAALSMAAAFGGGDLAGGVMAGIAQLADHARR
ncbi:MAG: DUF5130 family protein [Micromonosporaceae bacterium]|nr:DUF5130 family protein [Micromonosporaceae bacterium]